MSGRQENDRIKLVLFKDHHPPRSFEFKLSWFNRTGTLIGAIALAALISTAVAIRVGWIARSSRPQALEQLREENRNLRTVTESLEKQIQTLQAQAQIAAEAPVSPPSSEAAPSPDLTTNPTPAAPKDTAPIIAESKPEPKPETEPAKKLSFWNQAQDFWARIKKSPTQPPAPAPNQSKPEPVAAPVGVVQAPTQEKPFHPGAILSYLFLPNKSWSKPNPSGNPLKIALTQPQVQLKGSRLQVKFAIQYTADDGKNQQGRIILLVRSPSGLLAYPEGVLNGMRADVLIAPERGEFFSVGRYREVKNEFSLPPGPLKSWDEVEILIFQSDESLLLRERVDIAEALRNTSAAAPEQNAPKASVSLAPKNKNEAKKPDVDSVITPGTDR
jgi:hypothetical protein